MKDQVDLIISDLHAPAYHRDTVDFLDAIRTKYKPRSVKLTGDEINWESMSYHEKNPDLPGALDELKNARKALKPIFEMFPKADVMESNHGALPFRKAMTSGMPSELIKSYREILQAPRGWNWHLSHTFETRMGMVYMTHGKTSAVDKLSKSMAMSCIQGHYHSKSYISYWASPRGLFFDMNVGCLADDSDLSMKYGWNSINKSIVGCGVLVNGRPQLIPMLLNARGRWVGKL